MTWVELANSPIPSGSALFNSFSALVFAAWCTWRGLDFVAACVGSMIRMTLDDVRKRVLRAREARRV